MEMGSVEATPDLEELQQEPSEEIAVPVRQEGPWQVHQLPARRVQYGTDQVPVTWVDILPATPKRARAVLVSEDPFYVSNTGTGGGMLVPANTPIEIRNTEKVFVRAIETGALIGHMSELWAD
jgi:hypothetical protein